ASQRTDQICRSIRPSNHIARAFNRRYLGQHIWLSFVINPSDRQLSRFSRRHINKPCFLGVVDIVDARSGRDCSNDFTLMGTVQNDDMIATGHKYELALAIDGDPARVITGTPRARNRSLANVYGDRLACLFELCVETPVWIIDSVTFCGARQWDVPSKSQSLRRRRQT